jgi:hypothetical protein
MSHPKDRRDRFLKGKHIGEKRAAGMFSAKFQREYPDSFEKWTQRYRNTTKLCGKSCCANPRHNGFKDRLTVQERKFEEALKKDL